MSRKYLNHDHLGTANRRRPGSPWQLQAENRHGPYRREAQPSAVRFLLSFALPLVAACTAEAHPEVPGAPQTKPVALVGGTLHTASGGTIQNGTLLFEDGKIVAIGQTVDLPKGTREIDVSGKHVYPGLFDAYTNVGLVEINAVRATRDYQETGRLNPNVKAHLAVNPDSELIPVARSNGVLLVVSAPTGGLIAGKSAVMQLDGWTWEDLTLKPEAGLQVNWPRMAAVSDWMDSSREQSRDEALEQIQQAFDQARAYQKARPAGRQPIDSRWEAMLPVLTGEVPLVVSADDIPEIQAAVAFADREKVRLIIHGGYDAPQCATLLRKHDVPVIVGGVYRLPRRRSDAYDEPFTLPERLRQSGIDFCISGNGRFGASNVRNLPYHAAMAAAFGLPPDEALKAITLYPAQILDVDERVGSLEVGKDATLFVSDDDVLRTQSLVERAYIQGREVVLNDRHKRLWRKYQQKYRQGP